jgi:hypothetical protein
MHCDAQAAAVQRHVSTAVTPLRPASFDIPSHVVMHDESPGAHALRQSSSVTQLALELHEEVSLKQAPPWVVALSWHSPHGLPASGPVAPTHSLAQDDAQAAPQTQLLSAS